MMSKRLTINLLSLAGFVVLFFPLLSIVAWGLFWMIYGMAIGSIFLKWYGIRCLLTADQGLNAVWFGSEDETISSRAGKGNLGWLSKPLCKVLNWIDDNHCKDAIEADEGLK